MKNNKQNLPARLVFSYSLFAMCLAFVGLPIYIYIPNYYHNTFGLGLKTIGVILLLTRLVDTFQDPLFGIFSDKFPQYTKKIVLACTPLLGFCFTLLFYPFANVAAHLAVFLILTYSLHSIIYINYQAYAVGLTNNYNQKTRVVACREAFFIFGIILATVMPAVLQKFYSAQVSFLAIGICYAVLSCILVVVFYTVLPKAHTKKQTSRASYKVFLQNKPLFWYFVLFAVNAFSSSIPAVLVIFFVEKYLALPGLVWLFLLVYFAGLLVGVPLWAKASYIIGSKITTWKASTIVTIVAFSFCIFLQPGQSGFYFAICLVSGVSFAGDFSMGYSHLTDVIHKHKMEAQKTTIFSLTNFLLKLALAVTSGVLVYMVGFFEGTPARQAVFVHYSYALLPVLLKVTSVFILNKKCFKNY